LIVKDSNVHGCYDTTIEMLLKLKGRNAGPSHESSCLVSVPENWEQHTISEKQFPKRKAPQPLLGLMERKGE
jgi:hypothetical protein